MDAAWPEDDWERRHTPLEIELEAARAVLSDFGELIELRLLEGGKSNTNYTATFARSPPVVLRIFERNPDAAERERRLLDLVYEAGVAPVAPAIGHGTLDGGHRYAVHPFMQGIPATNALRQCVDDDDVRELARAVGEALPPIGSIRFDRCGLLDGDLEIARAFDSVAQSHLDLIEWSLRHGRAGDRLGPLGTDLRRFVEREAPRLEALDGTRLTHGDYKLSNLLVEREASRWSVTGVLDWEFASAFTPLCDVAICLRHRDLFPAAFTAGFAEGYRAAGGELPDDWRPLTRLLDVMNLVGLLNASAERPRVFARVATLLRHTMAEAIPPELS